MNKAGRAGVPFLFGVDYEMSDGFFVENPLTTDTILWRVGNVTNCKNAIFDHKGTFFEKHPISYEDYKEKFDRVHDALMRGDSFLANLTVQTPVDTDYTFEEIFHRSNSPYALMIPDRLVCFSPETFVKISRGRIGTNPMKGTISASEPNAEAKILADYKESAEHYTIVDFIRSDLSRVAHGVSVEKLRYIDRLSTSHGDILQVSSLITGELLVDGLGDILFELLPAGSVSGAPKPSTLKILADAERLARGYYCGVFGYFDGESLDSAVMIRYIENLDDQLFFRSGGGITINSSCEDEYNEVIEKIYLPFV